MPPFSNIFDLLSFLKIETTTIKVKFLKENITMTYFATDNPSATLSRFASDSLREGKVCLFDIIFYKKYQTFTMADMAAIVYVPCS